MVVDAARSVTVFPYTATYWRSSVHTRKMTTWRWFCFCPQGAEIEKLHPRGWWVESEEGAHSQACIRWDLCNFVTERSGSFLIIFIYPFLFAVEEKVKDQLEAANPEPIIEEVVSADANLSIFTSKSASLGVFHSFLCLSLRIWLILLQESQTGNFYFLLRFYRNVLLPEAVQLQSLSLTLDFRDLKRDVAKKLEKLERRTQRAIAELIRQYLPHHPVCLYHKAFKWLQR